MPYTKIIFIKLFLSLFQEDDRFLYKLNESQQLLYLKLLILAGITTNKIPKNIRFITNQINYPHDTDCFRNDVARIMEVFPKFKEAEDSYYFTNFNELHNWYKEGVPKEFQRNTNPLPKEVLDKDKDKDKDKEGASPFRKPSLSELSAYILEKKYKIDADEFFNFYESKGWMVGRNKMKNWKASLCNWVKRNSTNTNTKGWV